MGSPTNPARLQNVSRSAKPRGASGKAIRPSIGYLEDAFPVGRAQRYGMKGNARIGSPRKHCFEDVGLRGFPPDEGSLGLQPRPSPERAPEPGGYRPRGNVVLPGPWSRCFRPMASMAPPPMT